MTVVLRTSLDEEHLAVEVDGEVVAQLSYDEHGSAGLSAVRDLVRSLGAKAGFEVQETWGPDSH